MRATPGEREAGAAVAVVVNDSTAIAQSLALKAHARLAKWAQTNALDENIRFLGLQYAAAFSDDSICRCTIDGEIIAEVVCPPEDAIVSARDRIQERRVHSHDRAGKGHDFRHPCELAAVRLKIRILRKVARANPCAVDHETESAIDVFEFFEVDVRGD